MDIDKTVEMIYKAAKTEAERKPKKGERSAVEIINDFADKAMKYTEDKLNKLEIGG